MYVFYIFFVVGKFVYIEYYWMNNAVAYVCNIPHDISYIYTHYELIILYLFNKTHILN